MKLYKCRMRNDHFENKSVNWQISHFCWWFVYQLIIYRLLITWVNAAWLHCINDDISGSRIGLGTIKVPFPRREQHVVSIHDMMSIGRGRSVHQLSVVSIQHVYDCLTARWRGPASSVCVAPDWFWRLAPINQSVGVDNNTKRRC